MKKLQRQLKMARKKGLSPLEIAQMQAIAKSNANAMEEQATWNAFKLMICISINVLGGVYWQKTGKRKIPEYVDNVIDLYDAVKSETVTVDEIEKVAEEYGYKIEKERIMRK